MALLFRKAFEHAHAHLFRLFRLFHLAHLGLCRVHEQVVHLQNKIRYFKDECVYNSDECT